MEHFKINIWRHVFTFAFEFLLLSFCLVCCLPGIVFDNKGNSFLPFFFIFCLVVIIIHVFFAIKKNRWVFPILLIINEDSLEIDCRLFFLFPKKYCWKREDVTIVYYPEILKMSSIIVLDNKSKVQLLFESIATKKEQLNNILNGFRLNGYRITSGR